LELSIENFSQVFAVGDIHGCRELLHKIHNKILATSKDIEGPKLLIYLGDYIDRGPDIKGTVQTLIDFQPENFIKVFLLGNHEQMLLDFMAGKRNSLYIWLGNGGLETLESYGCDLNSYIDHSMELKGEELIRKQFTRLLPFSHKNFFNQLQLNYEWGNYFFVHAGINPDFPLDKQEKETMLWTREQRFFDPKMIYHKIIVHGHTPVDKIEEFPCRINLDTGAFYSGKLSFLMINKNKVFFFDSKP
jgi:serine/threonine protein phosphatase 1